MNVKELIDWLKTFNPEAEISRDDSETVSLSYISENGESKRTTKMVFIEKADYEENG